MSPEQVTGDRVDGRSDIFALGCVLYEMLSGRALFAGARRRRSSRSCMHDRVPDFRQFDAAGAARAAADRLALPRARAGAALRVGERSGAGAARAAERVDGVGAGRRPRTRGKSLAVLPFVNAGADPTTEYLTDGITESIINSVSQLGGLRVVPRSLVFRYKGLQADPATVGVALNARTILTGRVSQQGDFLTIQAELVDTATESSSGANSSASSCSELPNVQQDIAWQISEALRLKLTGEQKKKLRKRATVTPEAYQEYLRGRHFFNCVVARRLPARARALRACDRARSDLRAGLCWARRRDRLHGVLRLHSAGGRLPARAGRGRASDRPRSRSRRRARHARARTACSTGRTGTTPEQHFRRSIALNPKLASVRAFHAIFLATRRPARRIDCRGARRRGTSIRCRRSST